MVKNPPANAGDTNWIPGSERSPGEGNGNLLQYYCLGNPPGGLSSMESQRVGYNLATEKKKSLIVFKTVLCQFLLYSKVIQLYAHIYTHIFFLISLPLRFITGF